MRLRTPISITILALLFLGCQDTQLEPETVGELPVIEDQDPVRPVFNRTEQQPTTPSEEVISPYTNQSVFLTRHESSTQLRFPLNYPLGWAWPLLTMDEVPLLRPAPINTGDNQFRGYRQYVHLEFNATGNVSYLVDEYRKPDYAGTVLRFDEGEPYFAYVLRMNDRAFFDPTVTGTSIKLLGSTFQIMEATNETAQLNGLDVAQYVRVSDGERLETNNKKIADSIVRYDGFDLGYLLTTPDIDDDGFWLREGESIKERLAEVNRAEAFVGDFFDIRYDGLEPVEQSLISHVTFRARDEYIELVWEAPDGEVRVPVLGTALDGSVWHGNQENRAHFTECKDRNTGCIVKEDLVILHGRLPANNGYGSFTTRILELSSLDSDERKIIFRDAVTRERVSVDWFGNVSDPQFPALAHLPFLDREYDIYVHGHPENVTDPENASRTITVMMPDNISMDLDGDRAIKGVRVPLIIQEGVEVTLENVLVAENETSYVLNITIEAGRYENTQVQRRDGIINKEVLVLQAVADDGVFSVRLPREPGTLWDQRLQEEPGDNNRYAFGMSPWGTFVTLEMDDDQNEQVTTEEILFEIPLVQRFAQVSVGLIT